MVYIEGLGKWFDIYLASWNGSELVSVYNGLTADGTSAPAWHGEKFAEYLGKVGESLLWRDEFIVAAKGSNEETNIYGSADPNTTGGHSDTNNRRMISNYGLEDCCGVLAQWSRDCFEYYPGITWDNTSQYLKYSSAQTGTVSIYHAATDSQSYGRCSGLLRRGILGSFWSQSVKCGSRAILCSHFSGFGGNEDCGARGTSEPRV